MGVLLLLVMMVILLAMLLAPTIFIFKSEKILIKSKLVALYLCLEVFAVIALVGFLDMAGLRNPGGLILGSTVLVSLVGYLSAKTICVKYSEQNH